MMMTDLQGKKCGVEKEACILHIEQLSDRRGYQSTKNYYGNLCNARERTRMDPGS